MAVKRSVEVERAVNPFTVTLVDLAYDRTELEIKTKDYDIRLPLDVALAIAEVLETRKHIRLEV